MAYVYILKSVYCPKTYVGSTTNLMRRLKEHEQGKSSFTKRHRPWKVVYKEQFLNIGEERERERYFKSAAGRRFIKKILNNK